MTDSFEIAMTAHAEAVKEIERLRDEVERLNFKAEQLLVWLALYGEHNSDCPSHGGNACTCGLAGALGQKEEP